MHSTNNLEDGYLGSGKLLQKAIKKYGKHNFKREILHKLDTFEEMVTKEKEIVTEEYLKSKNTYNLCQGGRGGPIRIGAILSEETKDKISKGTKAAMNDENLRCHLSEKRKKRITKNSTREIMSKNRSGKIWITSPDGNLCKHLKPSDANEYIVNGWVHGRIFNNHMKDPQKAAEAGRKRRRSVTINGITYGCYKQAAAAINKSPSHVQTLIKKGLAQVGPRGSGY